MRRSSIRTLYAFFHGENVNLDEVKAEVEAFMKDDIAERAATIQRYNMLKEHVMNVLTETPITLKELASKVDAPYSTPQMIQYGIRNFWTDEVGVIDNGRNPNTYYRKAV